MALLREQKRAQGMAGVNLTTFARVPWVSEIDDIFDWLMYVLSADGYSSRRFLVGSVA